MPLPSTGDVAKVAENLNLSRLGRDLQNAVGSVRHTVDAPVRPAYPAVPLVRSVGKTTLAERRHLLRPRVHEQNRAGVARDAVHVPVQTRRRAVPHPLPLFQVFLLRRLKRAEGGHLARARRDLQHGVRPRGNAQHRPGNRANATQILILARPERVVRAVLGHRARARLDAHHAAVVGGDAPDGSVLRDRRTEPLVQAGDGRTELLHDGLVRGVVRRGAGGRDARVGARRARGGGVELFASSHLFAMEGGRDPGRACGGRGKSRGARHARGRSVRGGQ